MTTRRLASIINHFAELSTLPEYPSDPLFSDSETSMSGPTVISDNTNPFAKKIVISDKVGNALFKIATAGLDKDDKLDFDIENAQSFKCEMDTANANYVWGPVTFEIKDDSKVKRDLMEEWDKLTEENVVSHSKKIWNAGADMKTPVADSSLTKEVMQKRIRSVMMGKFIRNSLKKSARKVIDLSKIKFQFKHTSNGRIEEDGPIMLKVIYNRINPSTRVGV